MNKKIVVVTIILFRFTSLKDFYPEMTYFSIEKKYIKGSIT